MQHLDDDLTTANLAVLEGVEPRAFWRKFVELTAVPRPSRHEEAAIDHVRSWSAGRGYEVVGDAGRNLVVRVPATPGREGAPTVVLQGHLDMVCERRPDSAYDPTEGRIALRRDGDWLMADGTTLGADDGVAIAAMMALVEDPTLPHGALELLMTVAEEVGLEGANALDGSLITGRVLVNLDSEEDGRLTVGCAGSIDTWIRLDAPRGAWQAGERPVVVAVSGGLGGHSGTNIEDGRSNAIKVLGAALREALGSTPFRLASVAGGKSRNAIPRDAVALCAVDAAAAEAFGAALTRAADRIRDAFKTTDPDLVVTITEGDAAADAWSVDDTTRILDLVAIVPSGPLAMSNDFDDLVESSTSVGEASTDGGRLTLHSLSRSSNDPAIEDVIAALAAAARLAGAELEVKVNYRGWRPDLASPALAAAQGAYRRVFGEEPIVTAVHAGLETAVVGSKVSGLDMMSFGPQIESPHSPDERVSVPTVERFWRLLVAVVDEMSAPGGAR